MNKLNDYFGLICFLCTIIIGATSYYASISHRQKVKELTNYYEGEIQKRDSVNKLNEYWFVQDSIWHEAYKKIKH